MLYLYHGADDFLRAEAVRTLRARLVNSEFVELNLTELEGKSLTLGALRHHADALPFLGDKRIVIVRDLGTRFEPRRAGKDKRPGGESAPGAETEPEPELKEGLRAYLPQLPPTTHLLFVESQPLAKNNPLLKIVEQLPGAEVRRLDPLDSGQVQDWIRRRVQEKGGEIESAAVTELGHHLGADLYALDRELDKLLAFRNWGRVTRWDVLLLTPQVQEQTIFELTDAVGRKEAALALRLLHDKLARGTAAPYLVTMLERQFRQILQVKDLESRRRSQSEIVRVAEVSSFSVDKLRKQAARFTLAQLEEALHKLLDLDLACKTGRAEPEVALDVLIVELART